MKWVHDDGGRKAAGYTSGANDCVARAIAIAAEIPYNEACRLLDDAALYERPGAAKRRRTGGRSDSQTGVYTPTYRRLLNDLGWQWYPTMHIGSGCQMHLREGEVPSSGRLIVRLSVHLTTVIDGIVHDVHDPSRDGNRCVYGYWKKRMWSKL